MAERTKVSITTARKFVKLAENKEVLETKLKKIKAEMKELEEGLIDYFHRNNLRNLSTGDRTVYTHRQVWGSLNNVEEGVRLLEEYGYGDLINHKPNHQTFSAWIRELLDGVDANEGIAIDSESLEKRLPLPEDLRNQIKITEKWTLRVRKS